MRNKFLILLAVCCAAGCVNNRKAEQFTALPFPNVVPPAMMQDRQEVAEYMAEHWWDALTDPQRSYPCDSSLVSGVSLVEVEQNFANWTVVLGAVSHDHAVKSVVRLFDRAVGCERKDTSSNVFESMTSIVEKYLYDPNSPMRNEDFYGPYLERLSRCDLVDDGMRQAYAFDAKMCALNRTGTKATDFRFSDRMGKVRRLYDIKADNIILFFSNPGCKACLDIINTLKSMPMVAEGIEEGRLAVLNIYIDEDLKAWREYMPIYPEEWYNGYDPDYVIRTDVLYNVRAIPSLYLLDKDKKVIMKDAPEARLFNWLDGHFVKFNE
jgi:thiol-disulfide isomerase/thioredoxin